MTRSRRSPSRVLFTTAILAAVQLAPPATARAQAPSTATRLSLAEAVRAATTTGPAAQAAAGRRAEIVGRARTDAQWANPTLELRRENQGAPIPYDDFATLTVPIDINGRRFALRSALGASRERAAADSVSVIRAAQYATAHAWWNYWAASHLAEVAREQSELTTRVAQLDSLRAAEGDVSEAAAFRMRIEAQRARLGAAQAAAAAATARAQLAAIVGERDPSRIALAEPLLTFDSLPTIDAALAAAERQRSDLAAARATERAAERRRTAESRGTLPDVGLSGGYKGTGGYATAQFGLVLTPPLLNLNGGNRERTAGELLSATAERRATELRVTTEVRAALESAEAIDAGTTGFDGAFVAQAGIVAGAAEAGYREGAASLVELLDAFRAAADARSAYVRGTLDRALVRLDLRRAMGANAVEVVP